LEAELLELAAARAGLEELVLLLEGELRPQLPARALALEQTRFRKHSTSWLWPLRHRPTRITQTLPPSHPWRTRRARPSRRRRMTRQKRTRGWWAGG
jgi:hypothetical protein